MLSFLFWNETKSFAPVNIVLYVWLTDGPACGMLLESRSWTTVIASSFPKDRYLDHGRPTTSSLEALQLPAILGLDLRGLFFLGEFNLAQYMCHRTLNHIATEPFRVPCDVTMFEINTREVVAALQTSCGDLVLGHVP